MQGEMTDRLHNIQSAYLEAYLVQTAQSQPENITAANMLWKYYEKVIFIISFFLIQFEIKNSFFKVSQHGQAARVLLFLAENCAELKVSERLEYLSRASLDAGAIMSPTSAEEQLHREKF